MNLTYSIDKVLRIVSLNYTGNPDFKEWANVMLAVFRDPSYGPGFSLLLDRRLVKTAPSTVYIEKVVDFIKHHPAELGKCRTAIVVSKFAAYEMVRMSQALLNDTERTHVFNDIENAKQWLLIGSSNENA